VKADDARGDAPAARPRHPATGAPIDPARVSIPAGR
jgi:hypothetical protein